METRLAAVADAAALAALHAAAFGASCWSLAQIRDSLTLPTTQGWVIGDETPRGFMLCAWVGREVETLTLCIAPECQGRGYGRQLLTAMLGEVREQKAERVFMEVAADNTQAQALYQKCGFRIIGRRARYYRRGDEKIDAILLALEL